MLTGPRVGCSLVNRGLWSLPDISARVSFGTHTGVLYNGWLVVTDDFGVVVSTALLSFFARLGITEFF